MGLTIKMAAIGAVAFMVLDGVWLGLLMKTFYRDQLAPIVRLANGGIAPNWPAALVVYALLGDRRRRSSSSRARLPCRSRPPTARCSDWSSRRLRLHQLLDAAAVAVGAGVCRRRVGRRGIERRARRPSGSLVR